MLTEMNYLTTDVSTQMRTAKHLAGAAWVARLERGDADSGGSTLRTLGVVTLIVIVVGIIGVAILLKANEAGNAVTNVVFPW